MNNKCRYPDCVIEQLRKELEGIREVMLNRFRIHGLTQNEAEDKLNRLVKNQTER